MKLLIITQKVDQNDPVLSFMCGWIKTLAGQVEKTTVICLEKGRYDLPEQINVCSLGKEGGASRIKYLTRFFSIIWQRRNEYDTVFVHMNQEYLLVGGWLWKLLGKKCYMWRNHHSGSWLTRLAAAFCNKVFCTSKYSYTARFSKTKLMPVGVDATVFKVVPDEAARAAVLQQNALLFIARMAPVKKPHLLIEAVSRLGQKFTLDLYGDPLPADVSYFEGLKRLVRDLGLTEKVRFFTGVPNIQTVPIYQSHAVFVNLSSSGMYDKTIFETMLCGGLVLSSNENLRGHISEVLLFKEGDVEDLKNKLEALLAMPLAEKQRLVRELTAFAAQNSLQVLVRRLVEEMSRT